MTSNLGAFCEYVKGKVPVSELTETTYISTENMLPNKAGITTASSLPTVDLTQAYCKGDVLVSNIRPYFKKIWQAKYDGGCSNDVLVFRAKDGIDQDFLYYILADDKFFEYAMATSKGTKMPRGDKTSIMQYRVPCFDLATQKKIASLLRSIDEKVEINTAINNNLEQQAYARFKSWFVDFECFDEPYIEDAMGFVHPQSLSMLMIGDIPHTLETGKRPKGGAVSEGIPSIGAESVKKLGSFESASTKYIPVEFAASMKKGKVNGYEVMIYKDGGKPGTFIPHFSMFGEGYPYEHFFINEHVFKLDFANKGFNIFAYFYLQEKYAYTWLANNGGKAAIPGINQQDVNSIWIYSPDHPKVKEFNNWVVPFFTQILLNCKQNLLLAKTRDTILPRLLSGEIDLSVVDF